jgi:putative membrane protein insertion efficiency factor
MGKSNSILQKLVCLPIVFYQRLISPLLRPCCRYYPSCSDYALCALREHGVGRGLLMATKRLLRCHPWALGGYDPVVPNDEKF